MQLPWRQKKKTNQRNALPTEPRKWNISLPQINFRILGMSTLALTVVGGAAAGWLKLMNPQTLPVKQVQLEAPFQHVSRDELYQVLQPVAKGGFFNVDVDAVTVAVETLPWVESASVQRVWPDALHVTVLEQKALARWRDKALVSEQGKIFSPPAATFPDGLVELQGPDTTVAQMAVEFRVFKDVLQSAELGLKRVVLSPRRAWQLELNSGAVVLLGREEMQQRLQRFVRFYPQMLNGQTALQLVDMRYPNGFALKWQKPLA
jgi:cell division protein FtsQ